MFFHLRNEKVGVGDLVKQRNEQTKNSTFAAENLFFKRKGLLGHCQGEKKKKASLGAWSLNLQQHG